MMLEGAVEPHADVKAFLCAYFEGIFGVDHNLAMSEEKTLRAVYEGYLFGYAECDLRVSDDLVD